MIDLARAGQVDRPDAVGTAGGGICDDRVRFTFGLVDDRIVCARFGADACPATTAAAAWLAAGCEGASLLDAARLGTDAALGGAGVVDARRACVAVAVDALHAAIGDAFVKGARTGSHRSRVAVAMSGGVDSAVAMADAAGDAVGVTLRLWIDPLAPDDSRACCAPDSVRRARDACHARGLPHVALDLREAFRTTVVRPFVDGYAAGETPNPCTRCNGAFRLHELVGFADRIGAARVRTGHYARIVESDGVALIARGADPVKDQSYMLATVPPAIIARLDLPLGDRTKAQTRLRAAELGLAAAGAAESQEICFLGGGDYRAFLKRQGVASTEGLVVAEDGDVLGSHAGIAGFTPGQRRGVGVSAREPLYVLRTEAVTNTVVLAPRARLGTTVVDISEVAMHVERDDVDAKLRYRSPPVRARIEGVGDRRRLHLERPMFAVARGQTAALYDGDVVVGSGRIC